MRQSAQRDEPRREGERADGSEGAADRSSGHGCLPNRRDKTREPRIAVRLIQRQKLKDVKVVVLAPVEQGQEIEELP